MGLFRFISEAVDRLERHVEDDPGCPAETGSGATSDDAEKTLDIIAGTARKVRGMDRELELMAGLARRSSKWLAGMTALIVSTTDGQVATGRKSSAAKAAHDTVMKGIRDVCRRMESTAHVSRADICREMAMIRSGRSRMRGGETLETLEKKLDVLTEAKRSIREDLDTLAEQVRRAEEMLIKAGQAKPASAVHGGQSLDELSRMMGVDAQITEKKQEKGNAEAASSIGSLIIDEHGRVLKNRGTETPKADAVPFPKRRNHDGAEWTGRKNTGTVFANGAITWTICRRKPVGRTE